MNNFPKKIWFLWLQGVNNVPDMIKQCHDSWIRHNPDWEVILLHKGNLSKYMDGKTYSLIMNTNFSKYASMSDIIRINLLKNHGGVWVDSTTYCCKPLNEWLFNYLDSGFFAFASPPEANTYISSWFLAASKDNYIANKYNKLVFNYWNENKNMKLWRANLFVHAFVRGSLLIRYFDKNPQIWFKPFFTKKLKWHPYFWFHYLFERACTEDERFNLEWNKTNKLFSTTPHKLQYYGLTKPITDEIITFLKETDVPLFKLNRRVSLKNENSVINYLFQHACK